MPEADTDTLRNKLALIGICSDQNSSFARGAAKAPAAIRAALHNGASNLTSETGVSLSANPRFTDVGDRKIKNDVDAFMGIEGYISEMLNDGALPLILGGDHAITYPIMRAVSHYHGELNILHFDAHPDLYDELDGNRLSHGSPFARIMEEGLAKRLVQIGIRTLNAHQKEQARRFNVEVHELKSFEINSFKPDFTGPIYISFDVDAIDPAYAPGVSHLEPGGLSVRDAISVIHKIQAPIVGADIVEYNPERDVNNMTAVVAAKLVKEIGAKILLNTS
ncbi:MAG: agmatinase [Gammaproteobacteria bacterium]|nr:agmatinase [Gammaproteobacteria bacterium]